jgi:hypothetical protein
MNNEFMENLNAVLGHINLEAIGRSFRASGWTIEDRTRKLHALTDHEDPKVALAAMEALDALGWRGLQVSGILQRVARTAQIPGAGGSAMQIEESGYRLAFPEAPQFLAAQTQAMLDEAAKLPELPTSVLDSRDPTSEDPPDKSVPLHHHVPEAPEYVEATVVSEVEAAEPLQMGSFRVVKADGTFLKPQDITQGEIESC